MKKSKIFLIFLSFVLILTLFGCDFEKNENPTDDIDSPIVTEPSDPNWPVSVFETEIEKEPESVAIASPALAEYIYDMGLTEKVCAVSDNCGFGGASSYINIGSVRIPDMDAIKKAMPEYIISFTEYEESVLIELQQMNIKVITISAPQTLEELKTLYKELALFFKGAENGVSVGDEYVEKYDLAIETLKYKGERKSAIFIRALDRMVITGNTLAGELISAVGIENAAESYSGYVIPEENLPETDPDVIFVNTDIHIIDLESSDVYKKKTAVKGDMVYNADIDVLGIGSRRSLAILENLLATLYEDYEYGTALEPAYPSMYKTS